MLVLTRKVGESVQIGSGIEVKIISAGKKVRVGIEAPRTVEIVRGELIDDSKAGKLSEKDPDGGQRESKFAVLLVEDDPVHAKIITRMLQKSGARDVVVAPSGEAAVRSLWNADAHATSDPSPNLILLDLRLPGMSGLDVLVRIKSDEQLRRTPVVILSSSSEPFDIERCLEAGANAYVTKSPKHEEFCASLSRIGDFWGSECQSPEKARLN